jgi:hypothetical protein
MTENDETSHQLHSGEFIKIPKEWDEKKAGALPPLVLALWCWNSLNLELGEVALVIQGNPFVDIFIQTAKWFGALPVICLGDKSGDQGDTVFIRVDYKEPDVTTAELNKFLPGSVGYAAVDLSGKAEIIDILLNTIPRWGRMMFMGSGNDLLTIDYYNNLHRSGADIRSCVFDPSVILKPEYSCDFRPFYQRAINIISNEKMLSTIIK